MASSLLVIPPGPDWPAALVLGLLLSCSSLRLAAGPAGLTHLERGVIAGLACWTLALATILLAGAIPGGLRPWPLVLVALMLTLLILRGTTSPAAPGWWRDLPSLIWQRPRPERLLYLACALSFAMLALQILRLPPTGVDSLGYHLLGPVAWVQEGRIVRIETYWDWANSYPQNVEVLSALALAFFPHLRFADLPNLLFLALLFGSIAVIARHFDGHPFAIALACLSLLLSPFVIAYASATYCDLPMASALLASLALLLTARRTHDWPAVWWGLVAAGLAAGCKASGLPALGLLTLLGWAWLRDAGLPAIRWQRCLPLAAYILLALAGWWYLRSWWWYGNPFHPWTIALGPWTLFAGPAGPYAAHIESIDGLYVGSRDPWRLGVARYFGYFGGDLRLQLMWAREWFGPQVSIAGTVALGWWLLARDSAAPPQRGVALLLMAFAATLALLNPVPMVPRFAAHWPAFTTIALALLLTHAGILLRTLASTILTLSLALTLLLLPWSLVPIDDAALIPDRFYAYDGAAYWWTSQLLRPGDTVLYVQPLRATGRALPNDLSAKIRYLSPTAFSRTSALASRGTTWLLLAEEERVQRIDAGRTREGLLQQLTDQAPELEFRLMASGSTFTLRNYRLYALRLKEAH
ncbi:MAG: hypothetical protein GEEBNDBF_02454 [bacterium]|nr:hypothetical protein [bacterium]